MSIEIADERWLDGDAAGLLGQVASTRGLTDLIEAARTPALKKFLRDGATERVDDVREELDELAEGASGDVADTARGMSEKMRGLSFAMLTDGSGPDDAAGKRALPEDVAKQMPDDAAMEIVRRALDGSAGDPGVADYLRAYKMLEAEGYGYQPQEKSWVRKDAPAVGDVHVPRPMGSDAKKPKRKDDPGTQDVDPEEDYLGKADEVSVNVPLLIRLLEMAREEIESDAPLHVLAEALTEMSAGRSLTMEDYPEVVAALRESVVKSKELVEEKDDPGTQDVDPPEDEPILAIPPVQLDSEKVAKRISGNSSIPLNRKGHELADQLGERIALRGGLDVLYSSPLRRGVQTADAIADHANADLRRARVEALCPWHLGEYEGKMPHDVSDDVDWYIEHPDEVPDGEGADGQRAESFDAAKKRQLDFYREVYEGFEQDPTFKIGIVVHSRSMELLQAWVDDGMDGKYDVDLEDLEHPDDAPHASVLRWHNGKIKEVDLEDDDPLKPGVYLILHSLTDDDTDDGNQELEKGGPGSGRYPKGSSAAHEEAHARLLAEHDRVKELPGRTDPSASQAAASHYRDRLHSLAAQVAAHGKEHGLSASARSSLARASYFLTTGGAQGREHALMSIHDAIRGVGRVAAGREKVAKLEEELADLGGRGREMIQRRYLPPVEVARAAKSAWDQGASVVGITSALAENEGLSLGDVAKVAEFFAATESATASQLARDAWGGPFAAKWAARVAKKAERDGEWEPWVGVDLDGTLAAKLETFDGARIGAPMPKMVALVRELLGAGEDVRVFTARVADDPEGEQRAAIREWCREHVGRALPVTNEKDPGMRLLIDDIAQNADTVNKAGSGVMLALWPSREVAERLAVAGGEDPGDLHVTLAYFGKLADIDMSKLPVIERAVEGFAATHAPLTATLGGVGVFPATPQSDGRDVAYLGVHSDEIQAFRRELVEATSAAGAEHRQNFGYTPHMTLKSIAPRAPHLISPPEPERVTFDRVVLSIGTGRKEYPLLGEESAARYEIGGEILKKDEARRLVFGWFSIVAVEGKPVVDTQGDVITEATIEDSAYEFVLTARTAGAMHESGKDGEVRGVGRLVESVVFTREKQRVMMESLRDQGIDAVLDIGCVAWWGGMRVDDEKVWGQVTEGKLRAWSIGGKGKRMAMDEVGKYDPDQPRDERGRWGAGMSGAAARAAFAGVKERGGGLKTANREYYRARAAFRRERVAAIGKPPKALAAEKPPREQASPPGSPLEALLRTEEEMRTGGVTSNSKLGGGCSPSFVVTLDNGQKGVFKPESGWPSNPAHEVAAYEAAKIVGMADMVPVTVLRTVGGEEGSFMQWVPDARTADSVREPYDGDRDLARLAVFDHVFGNTDRHNGNWMVDKEGKLHAIDHGLMFGRPGNVSGGYCFKELRARFNGGTFKENVRDHVRVYVREKESILSALRKSGVKEDKVWSVGHAIDRMKGYSSWKDVAA